ncbi:RNA polymerase sigma factor [Phytohabitans rumicis]|uniref:DNA-directed RNA polymerase sigma-70 factor n=1 Tax=Phytohabitans rumicis TaxID=1076125 RepID=A0A6V8LGE0_9ACTN|nr:sigma-70 family RNA polymerase sigma factor [Phytohabitans rumicis]GFJ93176.1 DNA-directed RNA polymerase sigma-70 factor [Phytohabitans rumicis]
MDPAAGRVRFEKIYQEHYDAIWRFVQFKAAGLDPENILAEVFATAWEKRDKIPDEAARAWLYAVANNKIRNAIRGKVNQQKMPRQRAGLHDLPVVDDPADAVLEKLSFERVLQALASDLDREILFLSCHEGYGATEIAEILGLKRSTAAMRRQRLRDKLAAFHPATAGPPDDVNDDEPEDRSGEGRKR